MPYAKSSLKFIFRVFYLIRSTTDNFLHPKNSSTFLYLFQIYFICVELYLYLHYIERVHTDLFLFKTKSIVIIYIVVLASRLWRSYHQSTGTTQTKFKT